MDIAEIYTRKVCSELPKKYAYNVGPYNITGRRITITEVLEET
jgi:hypothetical protein